MANQPAETDDAYLLYWSAAPIHPRGGTADPYEDGKAARALRGRLGNLADDGRSRALEVAEKLGIDLIQGWDDFLAVAPATAGSHRHTHTIWANGWKVLAGENSVEFAADTQNDLAEFAVMSVTGVTVVPLSRSEVSEPPGPHHMGDGTAALLPWIAQLCEEAGGPRSPGVSDLFVDSGLDVTALVDLLRRD